MTAGREKLVSRQSGVTGMCGWAMRCSDVWAGEKGGLLVGGRRAERPRWPEEAMREDRTANMGTGEESNWCEVEDEDRERGRVAYCSLHTLNARKQGE